MDEVTISQRTEILSKVDISAGAYDLMDLLAIRIVDRSKIPTVILDGRKPANVARALRNEKIGTRVVHG